MEIAIQLVQVLKRDLNKQQQKGHLFRQQRREQQFQQQRKEQQYQQQREDQQFHQQQANQQVRILFNIYVIFHTIDSRKIDHGMYHLHILVFMIFFFQNMYLRNMFTMLRQNALNNILLTKFHEEYVQCCSKFTVKKYLPKYSYFFMN